MAIDFKIGLTISGVAVQPGYPAVATASNNQVLRRDPSSGLVFGVLVAADLPSTVAYKNANNMFTVAQTISAAGPALVVERSDAQYNNINDTLYVRNTTTQNGGYGAVGMGVGIVLFAPTATNSNRQQAALYSAWTTATDATHTAYLAFYVASAGGLGETMRLAGGKVGIGTTAPNFSLEAQMLDIYPAINIAEASTTNRRATIGFGLNAALTTGWLMGQSYTNDTTKDFYLLDATANAVRLRIGTNGMVAINPAVGGGAFTGLSIGATGANTNGGDAFVARAATTVANTVGSISYVGEFRASSTNGNRLLVSLHRRTADNSWAGTSWRLSSAVDNSFTEVGATGTGGMRSYIELANNGNLYMGVYGVDKFTIDSAGNIFPANAIFPGYNGGVSGSSQASYYFYGDTANSGVRTNGNLLINGNIWWGSKSAYLSGYIDQPVLQSSAVVFAQVTSSTNIVPGGGLGTNHIYATISGGLPLVLMSGEPGVSFTNAVIGYNYGALSGSASGRFTSGNGGGLIRFSGDGSGSLLTMDTGGTFRYLLAWSTINLGVGVLQGASNRLFVKGVDSTSSNNAFLCQNSNSSNLMYIRNDGVVWANQAWTISDIRTKEKIRALPYGLDTLLALRPVMFDFITGAKDQLGFIAQEVHEIVPEIVMEEEANADFTTDPMLALNPSSIIPILVRSAQQLAAQVEAQQLQLSALIARIEGVSQ